MLETPPSLSGVGTAEGTQCVPRGLAINHPRTRARGERRGSSDLSFLLQDLERLFEANGIKVGSTLTILLTRWL